MICKIKHSGLRRYWETGNTKGLETSKVDKIRRILFSLNQAAIPTDMDFPGYRMHPLKGNMQGFYAVSVSENWRIIFRFEQQNATDIDLVDYH